tara:strand:- start:320 stop:439 length:120 start_codon:yes stop_codon:yes gene_type:complete
MFKKLRNDYWRRKDSSYKLMIRIIVLILILFLIGSIEKI